MMVCMDAAVSAGVIPPGMCWVCIGPINAADATAAGAPQRKLA